MLIRIYPSPEVSFSDIGGARFFAKNVQAWDNLEFVVVIHFKYEVLKPDATGSPTWERMRVADEDQEKLKFFADTCNDLFGIINQIVEEQKEFGIIKAIFGRSRRDDLYRKYDEICKRASGEWITVYGRWDGSYMS